MELVELGKRGADDCSVARAARTGSAPLVLPLSDVAGDEEVVVEVDEDKEDVVEEGEEVD